MARVGPTAQLRTEAHELISLLLTPITGTTPAERLAGYQRWLRVGDFRIGEPLPLILLLERLTADTELPASAAVAILSGVAERAGPGFYSTHLLSSEPYLRCVRAWLGRDEEADRELARLCRPFLSELLGWSDLGLLEEAVAGHLRAILDEWERLGLLDEAGVDPTLPPLLRAIDSTAVDPTELPPPGDSNS